MSDVNCNTGNPNHILNPVWKYVLLNRHCDFAGYLGRLLCFLMQKKVCFGSRLLLTFIWQPQLSSLTNCNYAITVRISQGEDFKVLDGFHLFKINTWIPGAL